jgi:hypothetical protein
VPRPKDRINLSDSQSDLQRTRTGYIQGYNAQWAMSVESGITVGADVVRDANDRRQLQPMVEQTVNNVGTPMQVLVDTGYENIVEMTALEAAGITVLCPPQPSGNANPLRQKGRWRRASKAYREQMRQRLEEAAGKALYRLRKITIEPGFGNRQIGAGLCPLQAPGPGQSQKRMAVDQFGLQLPKAGAAMGLKVGRGANKNRKTNPSRQNRRPIFQSSNHKNPPKSDRLETTALPNMGNVWL